MNFIDTNRRLLIIGCGGHSKVITDIAKALKFKNIFYQDINSKKSEFLGTNISNKQIKNYEDYFFVAIGDNYIREKVLIEFQKKNPNATAATLIHPSSVVSENSSIDIGSAVMPLCVINSSSKIGKGVIVNSHSSLDHDNLLMDYSSVAPGVITGGNVSIGKRSVISIGSRIKNNVSIGSDTIIGASSYVNKDISNNYIAYGSPAKVIRERNKGDKYL